MLTEAEGRKAVDRVARSWVGTPYRNCAFVKGHGVDCGMLLREVFVEAGVIEPFDIPSYSPQYFLHQAEEQYLSYVFPRAREIKADEVKAGDVAIFKIGKCFAHGAIVVEPGWPHIVHAHAVSKVVRRALGTALHLGDTVNEIKFFSCW
jgi:cell wall-associated NlpC family hydrolase